MLRLITEIVSRGFLVDQLKVREHGPHLDIPAVNFRTLDLGTSHTYTALPAVVRYLHRERPEVMLSDKDRVNRTALFARFIARSPARLVLRSGTTLSVDLASRSLMQRWLQKNSIRHLYPSAHQVVVPSQGAAEDMSTFTGLSRTHIKVVPTPLIPDDLLNQRLPAPDHPWFAPEQPPVILSAGELGYRKDFATLLRAFTLLRKKRPCRLIILGRGKERNNLLRLARDLGVDKDFALPGFIDSPYAWMAHAKLFAFSSRWEGFGNVLAEALGMGTPVVSTDCPSGPAEILKNGLYGRLVPIGDPPAMAAAMEATLDNPLPAEKLREAARPYIVSQATDAYLEAMGLKPMNRRTLF